MPGLSGSNLADTVPSRPPSALVRNITNGRGEVPLHRPVPFSELYCLYGLGVLIPIHHRPMKTNRPLHFVGRYSNGRRQGNRNTTASAPLNIPFMLVGACGGGSARYTHLQAKRAVFEESEPATLTCIDTRSASTNYINTQHISPQPHSNIMQGLSITFKCANVAVYV